MWPDRVSNPGPLALESDALPTALRGPAGRGVRAIEVLLYNINESIGNKYVHYMLISAFNLKVRFKNAVCYT